MNTYAQTIDAWRSLNVLVIGDVMLDSYLNGDAERLCQEAPVPVVNVVERQDFPGGAANVAANVASLGANALLLSVVGADEAGDRLRSALKVRGVATANLISSDDRATLSKQRVVANSHLLVRFDSGTTATLTPALETDLVEQLVQQFPSCDAVIVSDYGYGVITPAVIEALEQLHKHYSCPILVDSKRLPAYRKLAATAVKPNYSETIGLLDLPQQRHDRVAQIMPHGDRLLNLTGATIVAVTLDAEGVIVFERDRAAFHLPATPAPTNHTSGAGDTFISTMALALSANATTNDAASLAATATAIVVTQPGTTLCPAVELHRSLVDNHPEHRHSLLHSPTAYAQLEHR